MPTICPRRDASSAAAGSVSSRNTLLPVKTASAVINAILFRRRCLSARRLRTRYSARSLNSIPPFHLTINLFFRHVMLPEIEKHPKWIVFGTKDHFQGHVPCSIMAIEPVSGILLFRIRPDPEQHPADDLVAMDRTDHGANRKNVNCQGTSLADSTFFTLCICQISQKSISLFGFGDISSIARSLQKLYPELNSPFLQLFV